MLPQCFPHLLAKIREMIRSGSSRLCMRWSMTKIRRDSHGIQKHVREAASVKALEATFLLEEPCAC